MLKRSRLFILTGAGISAESGLGTFRDPKGLWTIFNIEDVASIDGYRRDPKKVLDFYTLRRENHAGVQPNAAHQALARLEKSAIAHGQDFMICTQNVDDLHEQAGANRVLHMHGEIKKTRCHDCKNVIEDSGPLSLDLGCEACGALGRLRPDVVWFGEQPMHLDEIYNALLSADLFVAIGTSGAVYPAAGFVQAAREEGIATMEINLEPSENACVFDSGRYGKATEIVPNWVDEMIAAMTQSA